jgi:hypothetical protein
MRPPIGLFGSLNQVNKLVCQFSQFALEKQVGALLRECQKLNGNPLQFNDHDLPPLAYVPKIKEPRPDERTGASARRHYGTNGKVL